MEDQLGLWSVPQAKDGRQQRLDAAAHTVAIARGLGIADPNDQSELEQACIELGLLLVQGLMAEEVEQKAGPKGRRQAGDSWERDGYKPKKVRIFGREVSLQVPMMRNEGKSVTPEVHGRFASKEARQETQNRQRAAGVKGKGHATLRPADSPESGWSTSTVSRGNVEEDRERLEELRTKPLQPHRFVAILLDGIAIGKHTIVIAVGIDVNGRKHVLDLCRGRSERYEIVLEMLRRIEARGVDLNDVLYMTDGGSGLLKAIGIAAGDSALIQRCVVHKMRNVTGKRRGERQLTRLQATKVEADLWDAWREPDYERALAELERIAQWLDGKGRPKAAESVRRQMADTLTCTRLGVRRPLLDQLNTTNALESINAQVRDALGHVTYWGEDEPTNDMRERWVAWALSEAATSWNAIEHVDELAKLKHAVGTTTANAAEREAARVEAAEQAVEEAAAAAEAAEAADVAQPAAAVEAAATGRDGEAHEQVAGA